MGCPPFLSLFSLLVHDRADVNAGTPVVHARGAPEVTDCDRETYSAASARLGLARGTRRPPHALPVPRGAPPSDRVASNWCPRVESSRGTLWRWGSRQRAARRPKPAPQPRSPASPVRVTHGSRGGCTRCP